MKRILFCLSPLLIGVSFHQAAFSAPTDLKPDLIVQSLEIIDHPTYDVAYRYTIKNIGKGPANLDGPTGVNHDNVGVQAFVSQDTVFDNGNDLAAGGTTVGSSPLGNLDPGETLTDTFGCSVKFDPKVHRYLVLKVDMHKVVAESNEDNNTRAVLVDSTATLLASIEEPIELPNVLYDFAKWNLRPDSMASLAELAQALEDNQNVTIELLSHTDSRDTDQFNMALSQKRAQSVVDFLIAKGVDPKRLSPKGYGESKPRVVDKEIAGQHAFLKVGDVLDQSFIENLQTEKEKEIAYQINRRTEFQVLRTDYRAE